MLTDLDHANILAGVRDEVPANANIWGYGPVYPHSAGNNSGNKKLADCYILVDQNNEPVLPNHVEFTVGTQNWKIFLTKRKKKKYQMFGPDSQVTRRRFVQDSVAAVVAATAGLNGTVSAADLILPLPPPVVSTDAPSDTDALTTASPANLIGGDAIFNSNYIDLNDPGEIYWGTVAYVGGPTGKIKRHPNQNFPTPAEFSLSSATVSCAHVLYHKDGGPIKTREHPSGISFGHKLEGWPDNAPMNWPEEADGWPDLASATVDASVSNIENRIRGLGELKGVAAANHGDIVAKYGATTGLSAARDIGLVWRRLPDTNGDFFLIRAVSNQFSRPGDSGAAVVYAGDVNSSKWRKLAGFVLAGSTDDDEQYYLPALPMQQTYTAIPDLSAVEVSL